MENYVNKVLDFLGKAGLMALRYQQNLTASLKEDSSIVTQADISISKLFHEELAEFTKTGRHIILDEEELLDDREIFNKQHEYLWIIDPIDGTTTYYHGLPSWAIAVGLYKDLKPYMGAIYMPASRELIYCDDKNVYFVLNAFTDKESRTILQPKLRKLGPKSVVMQHRLKSYDPLQFTFLDFYSTYVSAFYTLTNRSVASFINAPAKLWDITATLPLTKRAGLLFRRIEDDRDVEIIDEELFSTEDWKLKGTYLITLEENYREIKSSVAIDK